MNSPASNIRLAVLSTVAGLSLLMLAACDRLPTEAPTPTSLDAAHVEQTADVLDPTASLLTLSVIDPEGDNTGDIDVATMQMDFDPVTGEYEIRLDSHPTGPFDGTFRVNINLFNLDDLSVFQDVFNDYVLTESKAGLELSGTHGALTGWTEGDLVSTNSLCNLGPSALYSCSTYDVPNPAGTSLFRSSVGNGGFLTNEDVIAFSDAARSAIVEALTPSIRVTRLAADVERFAQIGILTEDQAAGLTDKLWEVIVKLEANRARPALQQLLAFVHQVEGLVPAQVSAEDADTLIEQVEEVIAQLGG